MEEVPGCVGWLLREHVADALLLALRDRGAALAVAAAARDFVHATLDVRATSAQLLARIEA